MSISFKAPHLPFTPDPIDLKLYEGKTFTRPPNYGVENGKHLSPQVKTSRAATSYREWVNDYDNAAANYYALITGVDAAVGMIREGLDREGLADNTVIIFTSDNGYNSGSHGFGDKVIPYEEGSKSPLIIYDPRLPEQHAGKVSDAITANVDMAATIFALAGVPAPDGIDGKKLLPLLTNPAGQSARGAAAVQLLGHPVRAIDGRRHARVEIHLLVLRRRRHEADRGTLSRRRRIATRWQRSPTIPSTPPNLLPCGSITTTNWPPSRRKSCTGHGYERYPTLFDRTIPWEQKEPLLKAERPAGEKKAKAAKQDAAAGGKKKKKQASDE